MDEITNKKIKAHEIQTKQWRYSGLSEQMYDWFDKFNEYFFQNKLKTPVISFERTRRGTLGHFVLNRNSFGLKWNTNINKLYIDGSLVDTLATLLHEMTHQWQQEYGKKKAKSSRNNYHNVEFRKITKEMGIPSDQRGVTLYYQNPFISFLKNHGVCVKPRYFIENKPFVKQISAKTKLKKWYCGCTIARVAIRDFQAKCLKCGNKFKLV
jgi:hypothetical protein